MPSTARFGTRLVALVAVVTFVAIVWILGTRRAATPDPSGTAASPSGAAIARPQTPQPSSMTASASPGPSVVQPPPSPAVAVLVGAGDIADCSSTGDEATAELLDAIAGTVFTLGDNVYENGTLDEFRRCYEPTWGRHRERTMPAPGNHDYNTADAAGYYRYFGEAAGEQDEGYYAYDRGAWRIYVLNSNCGAIGGCLEGSAQERWLRDDLAANPRRCVLAMWHHPLFSSGEHGNDVRTQDLWRALYQAGAELILNGHDHDYERFAPQAPGGRGDSERGLVEIVVGTGGRSHYDFGTIRDNSIVRDSSTYGVLRLDLEDGAWSFEFMPVPGGSFRDAGSGTCH